MPFYVRFFAYDDAQQQTYHYLLADTQTSSMQSFTKGQSVLLIEQTEGSVAKTYVIANHPTRRKHP
ncbi:hypothetical protein GCM10028805_06260 [Spirosoma harenae]